MNSIKYLAHTDEAVAESSKLYDLLTSSYFAIPLFYLVGILIYQLLKSKNVKYNKILNILLAYTFIVGFISLGAVPILAIIAISMGITAALAVVFISITNLD